MWRPVEKKSHLPGVTSGRSYAPGMIAAGDKLTYDDAVKTYALLGRKTKASKEHSREVSDGWILANEHGSIGRVRVVDGIPFASVN